MGTGGRPCPGRRPARTQPLAGRPGGAERTVRRHRRRRTAPRRRHSRAALWLLPDADEDADEAGSALDRARTGVTHAVTVMQQWLGDARWADGPLVVATSGAVAVRDERTDGFGDAAVWGAVRAAQAENPGRIVLVDVEDRDALTDAVAAVLASGEPEAAVRDGQLLVPQLSAVAPASAAGPAPDPAGTVLVTGRPDPRPCGIWWPVAYVISRCSPARTAKPQRSPRP
ncbi:SpnB-like Rossmann fold domain-containing protein [Streptomyces chrestomyceticus]|uniref:SpnB-like Rossmann fold domain-containing protein n=1 Tax=Streptomyces chrestomyceticus TaxID=68185 RepID=UPI003531176C